jgi:xanthine dehydrogenase accessory factor
LSVFQAISELETKNLAGAICMVVRTHGSTPRHSGSKMLVYPDGSILGTVGGGELENRVIQEALESIKDGNSRLLKYEMTDIERGDVGVCGGQVEVYVEPIRPKPTLVVIGAGHIGKAVVHLAHWLGFFVVLNDDRPDFCTPQAVPDADRYVAAPMVELLQQVEFTPWTYVVLTTRGTNLDVQGLPLLLNQSAAYIGVIGSRRRWAMAKKEMLANGVPAEKLDCVHSPIGLDLNAETPEEIAVSIMAEIIMLRQGGDGLPMSQPTKSKEFID